MKQAAVGIALMAGMLTASGQTAVNRLERAWLFGHDYVRLSDWARIYNLDVSRSPGSKEVRLTSRWSRLVFTVDSRKSELNGAIVHLTVPVAARGSVVYIAYSDVIKVVQPILIKPDPAGQPPIRRVCLDPGHGGRDTGGGSGRHREKEYTLLLAREVKSQLTKAGLQVVLTRGEDKFVALPERPEYARRNNADLFVSLHFNSTQSGADQAQGVEVYCLTPAGASSTNARSDETDSNAYRGNRFDFDNLLLAYHIQKSMVANLRMEDRGVKHARFAVLREAAMPAVLVEAGFLSHPPESRNIINPEYRRKLATAIVDGILAYKDRVGQ